ncbi:MAG: ATP-dependent DNA helicase [Burkholderiaceae bacterium]
MAPEATSSLADAVSAAFAPQGRLAAAHASYRPRAGQQTMAQAVAATIADAGCLVVEAGTGIGKTYAYLVPALLSGQRVLISTATKALQDQLRGRDIPHLAQVLGLPLRLAMLKGRNSYVCLHRLQQALESGDALPSAYRAPLAQVHRWSLHTRSGDLAELPALDERSPLIPWITSDRDNCLGLACAHWQRCHVNVARREALEADVVVTNHHLFFADLAVRHSGMAELLPTVQVLVFDEAHRLNDIGVQFLGQQMSTGQWLSLARDARLAVQAHARGLAQVEVAARGLEYAAQALRQLCGAGPAAKWRWVWQGEAPQEVPSHAWAECLAVGASACGQVHSALQAVVALHPELARVAERALQLHRRLEQMRLPTPPEQVRWVSVDSGVRLVESPLDVAQALSAQVWGATPALPGVGDTAPTGMGEPAAKAANVQERTARPRQSWVFTSATLGDEPGLRWFTERCGLEGAHILQVPSPFNYAQQAAWYVPDALPLPADPGHSSALAHWLAPVAEALGGRTLVLTTTTRALHAVAAALRQRWRGSSPLQVLVQGEASKRELLARFRRSGGGLVLVATASFWEGVDIPGDALQCVVIDKLPFPPPGDPLVEARVRQIESRGGRAFTDHALPEAAVALKQGAGRLIRHEDDRGLLVIGDRRLLTQSYGSRLLAALPPMRALQSEAAFQEALTALTRTSTTDRPVP